MVKTVFTLTAVDIKDKVTKYHNGENHVQSVTLDPIKWGEILKNHPDAYIEVVDSEGRELFTIPVRPAYDFIHSEEYAAAPARD